MRAGESGAGGDEEFGAAELFGVDDGVVVDPALAVEGAPHVGHVSVAAHAHNQFDGGLADRCAGLGASAVCTDALVEARSCDGEVEDRGRGHRDRGDRLDAVGVELGVDDGREFLGQERLPLLAAEGRVVVHPVGVVAECTFERGDDVDVLVSEELVDVGLTLPRRPVFAAACTVEQVERRAGFAAVCRDDDLERNIASHGRGVHLDGGDAPVVRAARELGTRCVCFGNSCRGGRRISTCGRHGRADQHRQHGYCCYSCDQTATLESASTHTFRNLHLKILRIRPGLNGPCCCS